MTTSSTNSNGAASPGRRRRRNLALAAVPAGALLATFALAGPAGASATYLVGSVYSASNVRLCIDNRDSFNQNYNPVQVYNCNGTGAQIWIGVEAGSTIMNYSNHMCLDVYAGGTGDGDSVDLYQCNNTAAQVWLPQDVSGPSGVRTVRFYNPQSGKCLDDPAFGGSGIQLDIWDCNGGSNQAWYLG